jgi:hypothetical protein
MRGHCYLTSKLLIEHRKVLTNRRALFVSVQFLVLWTLITPVLAASTGAISQGYTANNSNIAPGTIVSLVSDKTLITAANNTNASNLVGVTEDKPLIELSNGAEDVQVVVNGSVRALVSNINGAIRTGDKITASPLSGIGMKATGPTEIVGTAQANLSSVPTITKIVQDEAGKNIQAKVGLLTIDVNVAYYSVTSQGGVSSFVPPFLQTIANAVSGHQVSPLHVLLGAFALLLGFASAIVMLYASIRSSIISIGRNPLAEGALRKGLVDIILASLGILIITVVVVYLILLS